MVVAREGSETVKVQLSSKFQEAIDEAAMQAGASDADAYLDGWKRSEWTSAEGSPSEVAENVSREIEEHHTDEQLAQLIDANKE